MSFAGDESLKVHKGKQPSIPTEHKKALLESLRMVDEVRRVVGGESYAHSGYSIVQCCTWQVVVGSDVHEEEGALKGLDFYSHFMRIKCAGRGSLF